MGLATSQGRYLCLTARNSDLIYEGQQISQQRLALTKETQEAADAYNKAMSNTVLMAEVAGESQQLTYDILTNQDPFSGLCMRLVDLNGNVVIPGDYIEVTQSDEDGNITSTNKITSVDSFIKKYLSNLDADTKDSLLNKSLAGIVDYYNRNVEDSAYTVTLRNKSNSDIVKDGEAVLYDPNCTDAKYLQEMLTSGQWLIQQAASEDEWDNVVWQGSSAISEVLDTSDDSAAEAEYEAALMKLQRMDKMLELRLEQVETEQESVQKELESIQQVIDKNIENSFNIFKG